MSTTPFALGQIVITPGAQSTLFIEDVRIALARHAQGDWGELCREDWTENERSLQHGGRLFSVYRDRLDTQFYIITESDRSVTTILLPQDY
jgi:hypothetical protein